MTLIVQKYGGTSVADVNRIKSIAKNILKYKNRGLNLIIVLSAMAGETNRLIALAKECSDTIHQRELDVLSATGEQITIALLSTVLNSLGLKAKSYLGWQVAIRTNNNHNQARIITIDQQRLSDDLNNNVIPVIAGFQGLSNNNEITTLGRGGSDTTAVALAAKFRASECQIYTDVNGIYNADPNMITSARRLQQITTAQMLEASSLGAKVLHVRSCELAYRYNITLRILSSFAPQDQGTLVMNNNSLEEYPLNNLTIQSKQVLFKVSCINIAQILKLIYENHTIDMLQVDQNSINFVVDEQYIESATKTLNSLDNMKYTTINNLVKFSLIGSGFRSNNLLNQNIWNILAEFEIFAVNQNEISMSILVHHFDLSTLKVQLSKLL